MGGHDGHWEEAGSAGPDLAGRPMTPRPGDLRAPRIPRHKISNTLLPNYPAPLPFPVKRCGLCPHASPWLADRPRLRHWGTTSPYWPAPRVFPDLALVTKA
jgi:hypothetical protein